MKKRLYFALTGQRNGADFKTVIVIIGFDLILTEYKSNRLDIKKAGIFKICIQIHVYLMLLYNGMR